MQWKIAGILLTALFITVLVAIKLLPTENSTQKSIDLRLQAIEDRLQRLEANLSGTERGSLSSRPLPTPSRSEKQSSNLSTGDGALLTGKTAGKPVGPGPSISRVAPDSSRSDERPFNTLPPAASPPSDDQTTSAPPGSKGSLQALDSFFSSLPAEKNSQAEGIFQAHLESLRYKIDDATKQGSSPQELNTLIYDDQVQIREEMKQVLSDQEYKAFLDATPMIHKPY